MAAKENVNITDTELNEYRLSRSEKPFQELNRKSVELKVILRRIPREINNPETFLEIIKESAGAIKNLLNVVNKIDKYVPDVTGKEDVEKRKLEFVEYSKAFRTSLKEYFNKGQPNEIFISVTHLIRKTNQIMLTIKNNCE